MSVEVAMYRWMVVVMGVSGFSSAAVAQFRLPVKLAELELRAQKDSNDPAAHFNLALAYWNEKRWDAAERSLRTAVMLDARFAPAYVALNYLPLTRRSTLLDELQENR